MSKQDALADLIREFSTYARARAEFLRHLHWPDSNRDPLSEFSEHLVAILLDGELAASRVQKAYDLSRSGRHVQVKYLANTTCTWVNEHPVVFSEGVHEYALVVFTGLELETILVFPRGTLGRVCKSLNKRHPGQDKRLQFTRRNYETTLAEPKKFQALRVEIYTFGHPEVEAT